MKIMMVAGEASGDRNGAYLARAILEREPEARLFGMGGSMMKDAGVKLLFNPTSISAIGFIEVIKSAKLLRRVLARFAGVLDRQTPDVVVLIDFPEFNMRLADMAKERGIPTVYYFSPSAWAWRKGRAKKVAEQGAKVCAVFPFEARVYEEAGADVEYVGHPALDTVKPTVSRSEARREFGCDNNDPVVALLPGSRRQEMDNHVTPLIGAAKRFLAEFPNAAFLIPLAHTVDKARVEAKIPAELPITIVEDRTYDVLAAADIAAAAVGTVCLEAALIGTPIVAVYRASASTYWLAKRLYSRPYYALPNIIAERFIVDELLQDDMTPENIARALAALTDADRRAEIQAGYNEVRQRLGGEGAVGRTADIALRIAKGEQREGGDGER